jgi:DNA topoisomerase VI subunit B
MNAAVQRQELKRETFTTSRLMDFFSIKELTAQVGHSERDWPLVAVKELVDNALDACEDHNIPPVIEIVVGEEGIAVTDNGPGIAASTIDSILDFTLRVSSREAYVSPTRGAQGNALKTLLAMPFVLDGDTGTIQIEARGVKHTITCRVDRIQQKPVISHDCEASFVKNGTFVTVPWPDSSTQSYRRRGHEFYKWRSASQR